MWKRLAARDCTAEQHMRNPSEPMFDLCVLNSPTHVTPPTSASNARRGVKCGWLWTHQLLLRLWDWPQAIHVGRPRSISSRFPEQQLPVDLSRIMHAAETGGGPRVPVQYWRVPTLKNCSSGWYQGEGPWYIPSYYLQQRFVEVWFVVGS